MAVDGVTIQAPSEAPGQAEVLTDEALAFLADLHRRFEARRQDLLAARRERQAAIDAGGTLDFLEATRAIREGDWQVRPAPAALRDRRVEITGPTTPKMVINALNSGARGFMADFEDSNSPTWENMVGGQLSMIGAVRRTLEWDAPDGRRYRLDDDIATLLVRARGWHLHDKHLLIDGTPIAGGLMDAGLFLFHNAREQLDRGQGAFFYLPKTQSHLEARLWADVFTHAQKALGLPDGAVATTVLIETLPAAFEMEEILYELRDFSCALNAGRWDYIFSLIKTFRLRPEFVLPDRDKVTMTVPFMRAYTERLVQTCHKRGAHAMGGMSAFLPSRTDEERNRASMRKVSADKSREAGDGFDGTWVAHPDFVAPAMAEFDKVLGERPNQVDRGRPEVDVRAADLLDARSAFSPPTEQGLRMNVNIGIQYLSAWLRGNGAAGIYGLMEDAATAEISRAQVWQWLRHGVALDDGRPVTAELVRQYEDEELERIRAEIGDDEWFEREGRPDLSRRLFEQVALAEDFPEFLTIPAYEHLP
jgi:malate synthase